MSHKKNVVKKAADPREVFNSVLINSDDIYYYDGKNYLIAYYNRSFYKSEKLEEVINGTYGYCMICYNKLEKEEYIVYNAFGYSSHIECAVKELEKLESNC